MDINQAFNLNSNHVEVSNKPEQYEHAFKTYSNYTFNNNIEPKTNNNTINPFKRERKNSNSSFYDLYDEYDIKYENHQFSTPKAQKNIQCQQQTIPMNN